MRRGWPLITCAWLAAVSVAVGCVWLPGAAWAQNAAESPPPAEPVQSGESAGNVAETGDSSGTEATGETVEAVPPPGPDEAPQLTAEEAMALVRQQAGNTVDNQAASVAPSEGGAAGGNVAEAATAPEGPANLPPPIAVPVPQDGAAGAKGSAPPPVFTPTPSPSPVVSNAAEARPAGTGARNRAEGGAEDESKVAVPPEPEYQLPAPADIAGSAVNYTAPEFAITVPPLQFAPERPPADSFHQPQRYYLANRPLPGVDEDEPEEERTARSIEESLALLNLAMEERGEAGVQIPLPSGQMTFKASDSFQYDRRNKILTFNGDVELLFNDIAIWADHVEVDDSAATAYARGYVAVQQQENIIYCDEAYLNYDTETLELFWVEGNTGGKHLVEPLYYEADRAYGTFDHMILEGAVITTCDPFCGAHRDYEIKADKVHYKPNKSIVLHNAYLFLRDTKTGWFPVLAVPLPKRQQMPEEESDIIQEYGWSEKDGYFGKFGYTYWTKWVEGVSGPLKGVAIMEIMTERGMGGGVRQDYYIPSMGVGTIRAYYRDDWPETVAIDLIGRKEADAGKEYNLELKQTLNLSRDLSGSINLTRSNSFGTYGSLGSSWNGTFQMAYRHGSTDVSVNAQNRINVTGGTSGQSEVQQPRSETVNTSGNFSYKTKLSKDLAFDFTQGYTASKGGLYSKLPADQEGNYKASVTWTGDSETNLAGYQASLTYKESAIDYDGEKFDTKAERAKTISDQLPSFHLTLPRDLLDARLGEKSFFNKFSIDVDRLVTGRRNDPEEATSYHINIGGSRNKKLSPAASLNYNTDLHQYWYSDSSSQYAIMPRMTFNYDSREWWQFNAGWNLTYHQGVRNPPAPRRYTYSQNANYRLTLGNRRSWRWILSSGYNFLNWQHNSIGSSFNWDANRLFGLSHTTTYNVAQSNWLRSNIKASWKSPYSRQNGLINWMLSMTYNYDTDYQSRFVGEELGVRYFHSFKDGWSGEILCEYDQPSETDIKGMKTDDYLKDFVKKVVVRKTGCCTSWEATWRTQINELTLILYLNALPKFGGTFDVVQPFDNDMDTNFMFPSDSVRSAILTDVVGLSSDEQSMLSGFY